MPSALNSLVGQNFGIQSLLYLFRIAANNTYSTLLLLQIVMVSPGTHLVKVLPSWKLESLVIKR